MTAYVLATAKKLGLEAKADRAGNVVVRKPASKGRERAPMIALQGHLDMVCEKNEGTVHDFTKDPIKVRLDGDLLRATGTTLGADNGVGVGAALAEDERKPYYTNSFEAIEDGIQFRPERKTPKPRFYGTINAKVSAEGDG